MARDDIEREPTTSEEAIARSDRHLRLSCGVVVVVVVAAAAVPVARHGAGETLAFGSKLVLIGLGLALTGLGSIFGRVARMNGPLSAHLRAPYSPVADALAGATAPSVVLQATSCRRRRCPVGARCTSN